jgi:hypothetical protein
LGSLSDRLENALLDHLANVAFTPAAPIYVALCTADPTDAGTAAAMNEVTVANGYARTAITFGAAASRKVIQSGAVTFPQANGTWGTITHWALVSSASGAGDMYAYGNFVGSFAPVAGNTPTIPSIELQVEILPTAGGAGFTDYLVHAWLNRAFRNQAFAKPATYVGLSTTVIADTHVAIGQITEVSTSGTNYARVLVNINGGASPTWTLSSGGHVENTNAIVFPTPSASWGQVVSMFLIDSASGAGNILGYDNQNIVDQTPISGDSVQFSIGALDLTLS